MIEGLTFGVLLAIASALTMILFMLDHHLTELNHNIRDYVTRCVQDRKI